jgi:hypothetical protein
MVPRLCGKEPVFWIRIGFDEDPDPAFYRYYAECGSGEPNQWIRIHW